MLSNYISVREGRGKYEVADVLRAHLAEYEAQHSLSPEQSRVCGALMACRTAQLGGHADRCKQCGAVQIAYNSCRDRHCPKCGKFKKAQWVARQEVVLLSVPYFHLVFTVDHLINELVPANQSLLYNLLFKAVSQTLKAYGQAYLGGELGMTMVLHTWGQTMNKHLHVHCVVTGGALSADGQSWQASGQRFLFPIVALSADYRDKFCAGLRRLLGKEQLILSGTQTEAGVLEKVAHMQAKSWEVYANAFEGPEVVYAYLSRYVHQVAISNYRISNCAEGQVSFSYLDNHDKEPESGRGKTKEMTLPALKFIARFLWHVLPTRFMRIRHYGLHHSSARSQKLPRCRELLGLSPELPAVPELGLRAWLETFIPADELDRCPFCQAQGSLSRYRDFSQLSFLGWLILSLFGLRAYPRPIR